MRKIAWALSLAGWLWMGCEPKTRETAPSAGASGDTSAKATSPSASAMVPATSATMTAPSASAHQPLPDLTLSQWSPPDKPSKPPTPAEWNQGPEVEVRNAKKLNCEVKLVREWVRVSCRNNPQNNNSFVEEIQWVEPKTKPVDFYDQVKKGTLASIVFPIRKETAVRVKFVWSSFERTLFASWSPGTPKPAIFFQGDVPLDMRKPSCMNACPGFLVVHPKMNATDSCYTWIQDPSDSSRCLCPAYVKKECDPDL